MKMFPGLKRTGLSRALFLISRGGDCSSSVDSAF